MIVSTSNTVSKIFGIFKELKLLHHFCLQKYSDLNYTAKQNAHTCIPSIQEQRQNAGCKFEACLVYIVS